MSYDGMIEENKTDGKTCRKTLIKITIYMS
jgi:hypothetical protein